MSSGDKYRRAIPTGKDGKSDVYDVLEAFGVTCQARGHAIKKLLCAGLRGKGDALQDLRETADAVARAEELEAGRSITRGGVRPTGEPAFLSGRAFPDEVFSAVDRLRGAPPTARVPEPERRGFFSRLFGCPPASEGAAGILRSVVAESNPKGSDAPPASRLAAIKASFQQKHPGVTFRG